MREGTPYALLGGEPAVRQLAKAFYAAMNELPEAQTIRRMHAADTGPIEEKLFAYLSGWMGGPDLYYAEHGTVCLNEPHAPFRIGEAERDAWLRCMAVALDRVGASSEVCDMLREPLFRVADILRNVDE